MRDYNKWRQNSRSLNACDSSCKYRNNIVINNEISMNHLNFVLHDAHDNNISLYNNNIKTFKKHTQILTTLQLLSKMMHLLQSRIRQLQVGPRDHLIIPRHRYNHITTLIFNISHYAHLYWENIEIIPCFRSLWMQGHNINLMLAIVVVNLQA